MRGFLSMSGAGTVCSSLRSHLFPSSLQHVSLLQLVARALSPKVPKRAAVVCLRTWCESLAMTAAQGDPPPPSPRHQNNPGKIGKVQITRCNFQTSGGKAQQAECVQAAFSSTQASLFLGFCYQKSELTARARIITVRPSLLLTRVAELNCVKHKHATLSLFVFRS